MVKDYFIRIVRTRPWSYEILVKFFHNISIFPLVTYIYKVTQSFWNVLSFQLLIILLIQHFNTAILSTMEIKHCRRSLYNCVASACCFIFILCPCFWKKYQLSYTCYYNFVTSHKCCHCGTCIRCKNLNVTRRSDIFIFFNIEICIRYITDDSYSLGLLSASINVSFNCFFSKKTSEQTFCRHPVIQQRVAALWRCRSCLTSPGRGMSLRKNNESASKCFRPEGSSRWYNRWTIFFGRDGESNK